MKTFFPFIIALASLPFITGSAKRTLSNHVKTIYDHHAPQKGTETGVYLFYMGNIGNRPVDLQIEMVTTIGIQYVVSVGANGKNTHPQMAIFYKFSKPNQAVYYNYLTHQSKTLTAAESSTDNGGPDVTVVGTGNMNTFPCTHLVSKSEKSTEEYWMSQKVPGFVTFVKKLNQINPNLVLMDINETVFNWGGLVKIKWADKTGKITGNFDIKNVTPNAQIDASDFDPPSK